MALNAIKAVREETNCITPLWPNFLLTHFLTNHGSFPSYLHKMNKTPSPNCNCPEKTVQTAHHLMLECNLWSKDHTSVLKSLPPPLVSAVPNKHRQHIQASSDVSSKHFKKMPKEIKFGNTPKVPSKY